MFRRVVANCCILINRFFDKLTVKPYLSSESAAFAVIYITAVSLKLSLFYPIQPYLCTDGYWIGLH